MNNQLFDFMNDSFYETQIHWQKEMNPDSNMNPGNAKPTSAFCKHSF